VRSIKVGDYQRYRDDMVLLGDDAGQPAVARDELGRWLWEH
jgi:hypothetical protein